MDSGVISITETGAIVTAEAVAEYSDLLKHYGRNLTPPIGPGYGVTQHADGTATLTLEAMSRWRSMLIIRDRERIDQ